MIRSESIVNLAEALAAFQGQIRAAPKREINPFYKSRYADLASIWDTIREPLSKNGLSLTQLPSFEGERLILTTLLLHKSGEYLGCELVMVPMYEKKDMGWTPSMDPQSVGKAITYARRYSMGILGVVADDDDDAESSTDHKSLDQHPSPEPVAPKGLCPVHNVPFQHREGVGAKGPYDFWACPQKVETGYCKERPKEPLRTEAASEPPPRQEASMPQAEAVPKTSKLEPSPFKDETNRMELTAAVERVWSGRTIGDAAKAMGGTFGKTPNSEIMAALAVHWGVPEGAKL